MKRKGFFYNVLVCAACVFLPFLAGNAAKKKGDSLKDVSKTYLGVYECKEMRYGGDDLCEYIESATLELKAGGAYEVNVTFKNGDKKKAKGRYEATNDKIVLIYSGNRGDLRREFSHAEGKITITTVLHGKPLYLVFTRGE